MKHRLLATALLLAGAGTAHAADRCKWEAQARSEDKGRIAMQFSDARQRLATLRGSALDRRSAEAARSLLRRADKPLALGSISGRWPVRSLQFTDFPGDGDFGYAYPFFKATISDPPGCGLRFAKTSGSQRRAGGLYAMPNDLRALAFLGAKTVNNDPVLAYDPDSDNDANSVGRLVRIGRNELLMLLDYDGRGFELYHLRR